MASPGGNELAILKDVWEDRQQPSRMFNRDPGYPHPASHPQPHKNIYSSVILEYGRNGRYSPLHFRWILCSIPTTFWNYAIGQTYPKTGGNLQSSHYLVVFCGKMWMKKKKKIRCRKFGKHDFKQCWASFLTVLCLRAFNMFYVL